MKSILVVDDHRLIYDGLENSLSDEYFVDFASSIAEALLKLNKKSYHAVLIDISLGNDRGFDLVDSVPGSSSIFFLSMHKSSIYINTAKELGARGYFLKDEPLKLLFMALRKPEERSFWMSDEVEKEFSNILTYESSGYDTLSAREQQVFSMLAHGHNYKEIALKLKLSAKTINNHRDHIMKKLSIENQAELVHEAVRLGILTIDYGLREGGLS